ncbi:ISAs1 family transposase [Shewanella litorisediminis]|uniref:ISAs1 family transposase n=1 Tax=Shewanella litorisediminis TaxID=1173586 RepID=A0ABX7G141_9GAMM|nr:ISAs1 family transposase [Shewanella litorisediminis]MCL2920236.1 ISAs1 family transposase [Shewanella litorisediminis]QRH00937.1 ISAs1 family transposase [Shewanella litorisediminis]QRH01143.1 ISAs1 family transposase [Shewanella litorisediminis]QRH01158.1 ISAs1 family transposase [Shewanella litorisediminis]QRH01195.1 ISAs1 family transposase [Shewanella litorisediminis]
MNLLEHLETLPDPRKEINLKHNLVDVVFLTLSAVLSGATGWKSIQEFGEEQLDWLRQYRQFEYGIPRRHCIANIIKALDSELLLQTVFSWINEKRQSEGKSVIALDGKTMRGAWSDDVKNALHVVSAFDVSNGVTLYQDSSNTKGKEAEIARNVIDALALDNAIVTLDALHCQVATMSTITQRKGDFVIQVKSNQKALLEEVQASFRNLYDSKELETYEQSNTGHGRKECRTVMQTEAELSPDLKKKWPHIKSLIEVASERTVNGSTSCSSRWYVSSLPVDAEEAARTIRDHWAVENQLHWVLDVVFREDALKVSDPEGAKHLALFNRAALSAIKQHNGKKDSLAGKRRRAAWSPVFRSELLFG